MVKIPLSLIETVIGAAGAVAASIIANKSSSEKSHSQSKKIVKPSKWRRKCRLTREIQKRFKTIEKAGIR